MEESFNADKEHDCGIVLSEVVQRVSVDSSGVEANARSSSPSISADGRFVAFHSDATNLVDGDTNGQSDIFVHDRCKGTTTRVSIDSNGKQGIGRSFYPSISGDGKRIAFNSSSPLAASDNSDTFDVFVHDPSQNTTTQVNVRPDGFGTHGGVDGSDGPSISASGRYVAFSSIEPGFVASDADEYIDVFVRDLEAGVTRLASVDISGQKGFGSAPSLSADGSVVAYWGGTVENDNWDTHVYVYDRKTGVSDVVAEDATSYQLAANGRHIALRPDIVGTPTITVYDRVEGTTASVSVERSACCPSISKDGRFVVFEVNYRDVDVHDVETATTRRVSGEHSNGKSGGDSDISDDGRFVVFSSEASNLVEGDTNGVMDIFVVGTPRCFVENTKCTPEPDSMSAAGDMTGATIRESNKPVWDAKPQPAKKAEVEPQGFGDEELTFEKTCTDEKYHVPMGESESVAEFIGHIRRLATAAQTESLCSAKAKKLERYLDENKASLEGLWLSLKATDRGTKAQEREMKAALGELELSTTRDCHLSSDYFSRLQYRTRASAKPGEMKVVAGISDVCFLLYLQDVWNNHYLVGD